VALNVLGLFLLVRWAFGASRRWALLGAFVMAVTPNPMHAAAAQGFMPQTFGTAALMLGLALLGRSIRAQVVERHEAVLLGLSWAFLLSVYIELLPILGVATAAVGLRTLLLTPWRRAKTSAKTSAKTRPQPSLRTLTTALAVAVLAGNVEFVRAASAIPTQLGAVVGRNIPWDWPEFWAFAMGISNAGLERLEMTTRTVAWAALTVVASVLLLLGQLRSVASQRGLAVLVAFYGLLALGAYYAVGVRDPWTGLPGHTWSVYKAAQWAFPLALAFQCAGVAVLADWRGSSSARRWIPVVVIAVVVPLVLEPQYRLARSRVLRMQSVTQSDRPFEAYRQLHELVASWQPSRIYLIDPRGEVWPRGMVAYFLHDWPTIYVDEDASPTIVESTSARPLLLQTTLPVYGCSAMLPGGVALIEDDLAVVGARGPDGTRILGNRASLPIQAGTTTLRLWSLRPGVARVSGRVTVSSGGSRGVEGRLRLVTASGQGSEVSTGDGPFAVEISVPAGESELRLEAARRLELADLKIGFAKPAGAADGCEPANLPG
jgi:hypothetical protein